MHIKEVEQKVVSSSNKHSVSAIYDRTKLHLDPIAKKNLDLFSGYLAKRSGLVFDAHPGTVDIFGISSVLRRTKRVKDIIIPVAASFFYNPVYWFFFRKMQQSFRLFPVYRKEEHDYTKHKVINFSRATKPEMKQANQAYMRVADTTLSHPGNVVVLAPYGGATVQKQWLRSGVKKVLDPEVPVLFTLSKFNLWRLRYDVYVGSCYFFSADEINTDSIHQVCVGEYSRLQERAGKDFKLFDPERQSPFVLAAVRFTQFLLFMTQPW